MHRLQTSTSAWAAPLCALLLLSAEGLGSQRLSPKEIEDPRVHGASIGQRLMPTREATDAPDPYRLDPNLEVLEHEGIPVLRKEKHLLNGQLRSRVHVMRVEHETGRIEEVPHGPQFHWHPNRTQWMQRVYSKGKQNGPYREWNEAGLLQVRGAFVDDLTHGLWERFNENGHLQHERTWNHGKREGISRSWYAGGILRQTETWVDGKETGQRTAYHRNGKVAETGRMKAGKPSGLWEKFHPSGQLASRGEYGATGKPDGPWEFWDDSGSLIRSGRFERERRQGVWFQARPEQGVEFRQTFRDGRFHGDSRCFVAGTETLLRELTYENGRATGWLRTFFENGGLRSEEAFPGAEPAGGVRYYHPDGSLSCEGTLQAGLRTGVWRYTRPDGSINPIWSGVYDQGRRIADLPD